MVSEPDGTAFHASSPRFVVTNNTDGTMTRFDFPADDFTQPPVRSTFASGGFRGDLSQVGADGCLYLTQDGTRYDDGTVTDESSLGRICGGFAPPPGVAVTGSMTGGGRIAGSAVSHGFAALQHGGWAKSPRSELGEGQPFPSRVAHLSGVQRRSASSRRPFGRAS